MTGYLVTANYGSKIDDQFILRLREVLDRFSILKFNHSWKPEGELTVIVDDIVHAMRLNKELTDIRENPAFTPAEVKTILQASYAITNTATPFAAAKRWVPWLCAYSGARVGEITQMCGCDIEDRRGLHVMRITPDAGTVKTRKAHSVTLHEHLIEQGFLNYVAKRGKGPLFYKPEKESNTEVAQADPMKPKRPRAVKARERLADWVRSLGVTDPEVHPNHAWRDTFKQIAERHGFSERIHDAITGHKPKTIGRGYGPATAEDMAEALKRFPRYEV